MRGWHQRHARVLEEVVKTLHSVKNRGFNVETAGGYSFLRPNTRFTPALPPGDFRYLAKLSKGAFPQTHDTSIAPPQFELIPSPYQGDPLYRRLLRPVLLVLAALALLYFSLWCLGGFPIPRYHFVQPPKCPPCTSNPK